MGAVLSLVIKAALTLFFLTASYCAYLYRSYKNRSKDSPKTLFTLDKAVTDDPYAKPKKVFFIHGWPDDRTLFERQAKQLAQTGKYDCFRLELPNLSAESFKVNKQNEWGWDLQTVGASVAFTITRNIEFGERIIIIAHDWGALFAKSLVENAEDLVEAVILCDIGDKPELKTSHQKFGYVLYQGLNILSFLSPIPSLGDWIFDMNVKLIKYDRSNCSQSLKPYRNYLYFHVWVLIFAALRKGKAPKFGKPKTDPDSFVNKKPEDCQILFVYGKKKPLMFHSQQFIDDLDANGQQVKALDIGHWLMYHPEFDQIMMNFLDKVEADRKTFKQKDYSEM